MISIGYRITKKIYVMTFLKIWKNDQLITGNEQFLDDGSMPVKNSNW